MPDGVLVIPTPEQVRAVATSRGADGRRRAVRGNCGACCGPCPGLYRYVPCSPGSAYCPPTACELFVCTTVACCDGAPPSPLPGVIQFAGICYRRVGQVATAPAGALVIGQLDFCSGAAACLPADATCEHPACTCNPGTYLYWQACPCPGGAGGGACPVISLADYAALAASLGSDCVVANAGGEGGCLYVSFYSPRASSLPPGCVVFSPSALEVTDTCCDCCPGCASARITAAQCAGVRATNPKWSCLPAACCCQRVLFNWDLRYFLQPADPLYESFTFTSRGSYTVDLVQNPAGVTIQVPLSFVGDRGSSGTETVNLNLYCGAHLVGPPGWGTFYDGQVSPIAEGSSGDTSWTQSGVYGCSKYVVSYRELLNLPPPFRQGIKELDWTITATPAGGSVATCGRGCGGRSIIVRPGPCDGQVDPANPAGDGMLRGGRGGVSGVSGGCAGCGGNPFGLPSRAELEAM